MPDWPARMRREVAALYVGPVTPGAFDKLVEQGIMPKPVFQGSMPVWLRKDIDRVNQSGQDGIARTSAEEWEDMAGNI